MKAYFIDCRTMEEDSDTQSIYAYRASKYYYEVN